MQKDDMKILQQFIAIEQQRDQMKLKVVFQAKMDYLQYLIRTQFDKNCKQTYKTKKRKSQLDQQLIRSLKSMQRQQVFQYYQQNFNLIKQFEKGNHQPPALNKQTLTGQAFTRSFNLKIWKLKKIRLDRQKHMLYAQKSPKIKLYSCGDYIIRGSKNKQYHTFVLEAINSSPHQKSRTVHIGFNDPNHYRIWYEALLQQMRYKLWEKIIKAVQNKNNQSAIKNISIIQNNENKKQQNESSDQSQLKSSQVSKKSISNTQKQQNSFKQSNQTIVDKLLQSDNQEQVYKIVQKDKNTNTDKVNLDIFHKIAPDYQIQDLESDNGNYEAVINQPNLRVIHHQTNPFQFKIYMHFSKTISRQLIFSAIINTNFFTKVNPAIYEIITKTMIGSQNSAIIYQQNKAYNKLYRSRDFIYIRHAFSIGNQIYIVDKSIQHSDYPPFLTIVRGNLFIVWGILQKTNQNLLVIDINQQNNGYLNQMQQMNLTMMYIQGLKQLQKCIKKEQDMLRKCKIFDINWDISKNQKNKQTNQIRKLKKIQRIYIQKDLQTKKNNQKIQENKSIEKPTTKTQLIHQKQQYKTTEIALMKQKQNMEIHGEIDLQDIKMKQNSKLFEQIVRTINQSGQVVINKKYLSNKYKITPFPMQYIYQDKIIDHPIWKGQWMHDDENGGIIFINQKKINDQKGVLKFILAKIGKNLLSGKGVLNISLPVDIFAPQSNLQRLLSSLSYGPLFLQKAYKKSPLQALKLVIAFGLSISPIYLSMEKPFNPILGETFQSWINGCPAYAEQISHHPPIAAILFIGKGYKVSAQLQSKVQLHMNSGCGTNDGIYRVNFDDGIEICFITPGGQISGLTYGDRKFNMVGKSYYWIQKHNLVIQIIFNPSKKGFFSIGKQQNPIDYFQGQIYQVKSQFMKQFVSKKRGPNQKQILNNLGKISGIWNKYVNFESECILDIDKMYPLKVSYQEYPLPSDANWRQDIHYRRIMQISRAQTQKQRLEVLQRGDRKLRQTYKKKK